MTTLPYALQDKVSMPNPHARRMVIASRWIGLALLLLTVAAMVTA